MIAEIGLFSLILALLFSLGLMLIPAIGLYLQKKDWMQSIKSYSLGQFIFLSLAYACLTFCFLNNDFSVNYVLRNASIALPWFYKCCAVWGGHEGSMLLWVWLLSLWTLAVQYRYRKEPIDSLRVRLFVVLGTLSFGFILFLLTTSNPFLRQATILDSMGQDLNPFLQDVGFLFHPPMLYMGYVGFSVTFALALAALWEGKMSSFWYKQARFWTLAAWSFLGLGITLGSWWAYRELGWGGWWFWDPVENASFMPWLIGTALIHSLMMSEKKDQLKVWTLLLAITTFSLSLIGTFLVRSGVLTSVHAFAVDPKRGLFILCFLMLVIGGALLLFAFKAQRFQEKNAIKTFFSRESMFLMNNILFYILMLTVLLGTLYPLIVDGLGFGKLSVGAPYFNAVFVPLFLPVLLIMNLGVNLPWGGNRWETPPHFVTKYQLPIQFILSTILACFIVLSLDKPLHEQLITSFFGILFSLWLVISTLKMIWNRYRRGGKLNIRQPFWGMILAHLGIAVAVLGIAISSQYSLNKDIKVNRHEPFEFAGHRIEYCDEISSRGPNYESLKTVFKITKGNKNTWVYPEKRLYDVGQLTMTESAIDAHVLYDLYIALGEPIGANTWSIRLYYKPCVRWIWAGGLMIVAGGLISLINRRHQFKYKDKLQ